MFELFTDRSKRVYQQALRNLKHEIIESIDRLIQSKINKFFEKEICTN